MKKILTLIACFGFIAQGFAAEPVYPDAKPNSAYTMSHGTVSISSGTPTEIAAVSGYRTMYIGDPDVTKKVFYTLGGSSTTVTSVGWWFYPNQGTTIEYNGITYLQLADGESTVTLRKVTATNR